MDNPLVSIIVTTFNRPTLLIETVRSLLTQSYQHFEILVVDNNSVENVGAVLETFRDDRIRFFKNANRGIIAVNRNVGILQARGQMLAFCDDDDSWFPNKLERQLKMFNADRHIGIGASSRIIGGGGSYRRSSLLKGGERGLEELMRDGPPPFSSLLVVQTGLLFSEDVRFRNVEDFDFQLRLVHRSQKKIAIIEEPLIYYRIHANNHNRDRAERLNGIRVLRVFKQCVPWDLFRRALGRQFFLAGILSLRCGDREAAQFFRRAIILEPKDIKSRMGYCVSQWPHYLWGWAIRIYYFLGNMTHSILGEK
jgi:teichuronic acid biosynthesis glycosyltransferase TuaG